MTCGRSVKEFSFISYFLFLTNRSTSDHSLSAALFRILSPITPLLLSGQIISHASVYLPICDALEWMEMQTGLPFSELLKL